MSGKRNVLSYQVKRQIIEEMASGTKNNEVCKKFGIPSSTVSTLWKDRQRIMSKLEEVSPFCKRARKSTKDDLDTALMAWIKTEGQKVNLNGTVLRIQADKIAAELGHVNFNCSKGWLHRFRTRHNIIFGKSKHDSRLELETEWLKVTWNEILRKSYVDEDVYAAHEVGLFYDTTPEMVSNELTKGKCFDGQLPEKRLTVLLCCNMDGTDKRPLAVVGSSYLASFSDSLEGMLMTYSHNDQSWMTEEIFEKEMFLWDEELRQANRNVLVLVNNCSAHVKLNALENISLCFLPRDATGLQPIDRGIGRNFRSYYRRQLIIKNYDFLKEGASRKISLMEALNLVHQSWVLTDCDIIKNAFANAGLLESGTSLPLPTSESPHIGLSEWLEERNIGLEVDNLDVYEFFDEGLSTCISNVTPSPSEGLDVKQLGVHIEEPSIGGDEGLHSNKQAKPNPCVACLGLLQRPYSDLMIDAIVKGANISEYDAKTFNVSMNLPSSYLLRSESLLVELRKHFPAFYEDNFEGQPLLSLKDAFKACFGHQLGKTFNLTLDLSSGFVIDVEFKYDDDLEECKPLCSLRPGIFTRHYVRKNGYTKNRIESILETMDNEEFIKAFPVPPVIPSQIIRIIKVALARESTNVAGRYNKYCRDLPQTPWLLNGERKMESSVEEIISGPIVALLGGTSSKFASSGREDVDVRSLGMGRPFNVEVLMPKFASLTFDQFRALEMEITEKSDGKLLVRDLQIVARESLVTLKQGEEEKTKEYSALCICPDGIPDCLEDAACRAPLVLDQSTPIRVLHRRPVAVRQKEILEMSVTRLEEDKHKFILNLKTQAGTYIKEFIHGDFGRTKPSFGDLLGGVKVDILALDVTDIALDWPPRIPYGETKSNGVSVRFPRPIYAIEIPHPLQDTS